ncbi:MAG: PAS domain S-box protein [Bryobacteraceae bacterium]|jgi:PAS domain S-box-containing protein
MSALVFSHLLVAVAAAALVCLWAWKRRAAEAPYRPLFDEAPVPYQQVDRDGVVRRVNRAQCELMGLRPGDLLGEPVWAFAAPEEHETCRAGFMRMLEGQPAATVLEYGLVRADGRRRMVRAFGTPVRDARGGLAGLLVATLDATACHDTELALRESVAHYRNLFENSPIGIYRTTPDGRILLANPALAAMLGYSSVEELAMCNLEQEGCGPRYDRNAFKQAVEREGAIRGQEALWTKRDGRLVFVRESATVARDEAGRVRFYEGTAEDVSACKQAEAALRETSGRLEAVIRASPLAIWSLDRDATVRIWNPAAEAMFGWSQSEVIGRPLPIAPPERQTDFLADLERCRERAPADGIEREAARKDGSRLLLGIWTAPLNDLEGAPAGTLSVAADITERQRRDQLLRESEQRYRELFENAQDVVFSMDLRGNLRAVNKAAEHATGYRRQELLTMNLASLLAPGQMERAREVIEEILAGGPPVPRQFTVATADGRLLPFEVGTRLEFDNGRPAGLQGIARDITERNRWQQQIEQSAHELQQKNTELETALAAAHEATEAKSCFLANMSHEIRTPMNGVMGMAELLLGTPLAAEQRECAETIKQSAEALLVVIDDILDISKIEAGRLELHPVIFDPREPVEGVVALLRAQAQRKRLGLVSTVEERVPHCLRGDPARLRQVLINLLGNAVKFTEQGQVTATVTLEEESPSTATVRFVVQDTGIGIPHEHTPDLFQSFTQADSSTTRKYGGSGLGLAISKQLVEMMGGQIGFESESGQGSTFWFVVPLEKCVSPSAGPAAVKDIEALGAALRRPGPASVRVLLAEDNRVNRTIALRMLERSGYQADAVSNGLLVVEAALSGRYDIVLMDVHMPEMDGLQATAEIRRRETGQRLPIVAMTARAMAGDREGCLEAGMDDYLSKPVRREELVNAIERCLRPKNPPPPSQSPCQSVAPAPPTETGRG